MIFQEINMTIYNTNGLEIADDFSKNHSGGTPGKLLNGHEALAIQACAYFFDHCSCVGLPLNQSNSISVCNDPGTVGGHDPCWPGYARY